MNNILEVVLGDDYDSDIDVGGEDDLYSDNSDWEYEGEPELVAKNTGNPAAEVDVLPERRLDVLGEACQNHDLLFGTGLYLMILLMQIKMMLSHCYEFWTN